MSLSIVIIAHDGRRAQFPQRSEEHPQWPLVVTYIGSASGHPEGSPQVIVWGLPWGIPLGDIRDGSVLFANPHGGPLGNRFVGISLGDSLGGPWGIVSPQRGAAQGTSRRLWGNWGVARFFRQSVEE